MSSRFSVTASQEDFLPGETLRVLPCGHLFHPECIDPWIMHRRVGTLCRAAWEAPRELLRLVIDRQAAVSAMKSLEEGS